MSDQAAEASEASEFRAGLIDGLRAARATEREIFAALGAAERDRPAADGGWSAKDIQAHLSAWRGRQVERLAVLREGRDEPSPASIETDAINATLHAERADWAWERVAADAEASAEALVAEVEAASGETLMVDRISGSIMGNGPEHTLTHVSTVAPRAGLEARPPRLAETVSAILDRGGWPARAAAFARYNLACFHALGGRLDIARALLRQALPEQEELRTFAPDDDDLIALRAEIPSLMA